MGEHKEAINNLDEREFDRIRAIIQSMTPAERDDVKLLNASRRIRIAGGSGTSVTDVNQLVQRFTEARKMMSQMARGGGMPGMPGMAGLPGGMGASRPTQGQEDQEGQEGPGRSQREPREASPPGVGPRHRRRDDRPITCRTPDGVHRPTRPLRRRERSGGTFP